MLLSILWPLLFSSLTAYFCEAIDSNEILGPCIFGFDVFSTQYINENEGVWFPQYRTRKSGNEEFKCHTVYESMKYISEYEGTKYNLVVTSYFTKGEDALKTPYSRSYLQAKRGLLTYEDMSPDDGDYQVKNFIIQLTPDYRVRYVCSDVKSNEIVPPVVYIESKNMTPNLAAIENAIFALRQTKIRVTLDRIVQENCTRPIDMEGYPEYGESSSES